MDRVSQQHLCIEFGFPKTKYMYKVTKNWTLQHFCTKMTSSLGKDAVTKVAMLWDEDPCLKLPQWNARTSPPGRLEQCRYWPVGVLVAKWRPWTAWHLWRASFWWRWRDGNSYPGCTRSCEFVCAAGVGCPGSRGRGREEDAAVALRLSVSPAAVCVCSLAAAWCTGRREQRRRRRPRDAGNSLRYSAAPSETTQPFPRSRRPWSDPESRHWGRHTVKNTNNNRSTIGLIWVNAQVI